ncbi:MAG TPA: prenyltransferase/squalene oxidase repeat-containing protein [Thermomicrobiales bacterium]|nr:prenyltransferase/squalene oxidase repeat-containing protein [Thermomicrobiales bacterium]
MFTRRRRSLTLVLLLVLLALIAIPLLTRDSDDELSLDHSTQTAIDWLRSQQLPAGAFAGFSGGADPGMTADAVLAFAAVGVDPDSVSTGDGASAIDYLRAVAGDIASDAGLAAKVALALHAAGENPRDVGGVDLIAAIDAAFDETTGWHGLSFYGHALAALALDAADAPVPAEAVEAMLAAQTPEGSWGFAGSPEAGSGDSNTTALAIQALVAVGQGGDAVERGLDYLRSLQDDDGAVAYDASAAPNLAGDANSTALAIQAFVAAGHDPTALPGGDLRAALVSFQNESGAFQFQSAFPDDSLLATAQAIPALMGVALPYDPVARAEPALAPTRSAVVLPVRGFAR